MSFRHRIRTIYGKELVDILRDRRTLIAMIVVPIVLYPLLMLGSLQAVNIQAESLEDEALIVGVLGERQARALQQTILADARLLPDERPDGVSQESSATSLEHFEVRAFLSRTRLEDAVRMRAVHVGVILPTDGLALRDARQTNDIELLPDLESVRSSFALNRLRELFDRVAGRAIDARKAQLGLPPAFDQPITLTVSDLSTPSSILGQVLPLILILMTITGAIYPAIDLTAGERERGTLESLMVCPVPVIDLIVGKFLVVTTVAIMGATLNLASVTVTVYYGGFDKVIAGGSGVPIGTMLLILLCLIPFAVLMSAIMIAVCSYARTFKEAQNYVTPVILAVLIPGGIAALPATRLEGIMLVMPVGNMVLLARDFLLGAFVPWSSMATVLLATSLYAAAAVAVAANIFGQESVVFADAGSLKSAFTRNTMKPTSRPGVSMGLLVVALLFPVWFFVQASLSPEGDGGATGLLTDTAWLMPLLFIGAPLAILLYWKIDPAETFALRVPTVTHLLAGVLIGLSAWVPAREMHVFQAAILGAPRAVLEQSGMIAEALQAMPLAMVFLVLAIVPAISEELLFRGFLLSALGGSGRKWTAILVSAAMFGVFHFLLFKFPVTAALGVVLAYLCWQSRSIIPGIIAHGLHNAIGAYSAVNPEFYRWMNIDPEAEWAHLPAPVLIIGCGVFLLGLTLAVRKR